MKSGSFCYSMFPQSLNVILNHFVVSNRFRLYLDYIIKKIWNCTIKIIESLKLVQENVKQKNINFCIICQKNKSTEKLDSTENSRKKLLTASQILKDRLFDNFNDNNILSVKYHCSCYETFILRSVRQIENKLGEISSAENNTFEQENKRWYWAKSKTKNLYNMSATIYA